MYGLVNIAVQDLVTSRFGQDTWDTIKREAQVEDDMFLSMEAYPDDLTYRLVGAASTVLNVPAADLLDAFGEHWVKFTAAEGYGEFFRMGGATLPAFLQNLDRMHARVALSFPDLRPPFFRCTDVGERSLSLHYHSPREGLAPMVTGLLRGLGTLFATPVTVTHTERKDAGADHDVFLVEYGAATIDAAAAPVDR